MITRTYAGAAHWTAEDRTSGPGGLFRRAIGDDRWQRLGGGLPAAADVFAIAVHPRDPRDTDVLYAGTVPAAADPSDDGGDTWRRLRALRAPSRVKTPFPTRVTRLAADPSHPQEICAALEVDGVVRSGDGGESWEDVSHGLVKLAERPHLRSRIVSDTEIEGMLDTHALCVSSAAPGTVCWVCRVC